MTLMRLEDFSSSVFCSGCILPFVSTHHPYAVKFARAFEMPHPTPCLTGKTEASEQGHTASS